MLKIYNSLIPFPGYKAMNVCGILFIRREYRDKMSEVDLTHEEIHSKQWMELLIIGFLLWYVIEWLIRVLFTKDRFTHRAYRNISLEREAYLNEDNADYISLREPFNFLNYIHS